MRAGVTCFLGVNVEGALLSVGDGHYRQGEGEACGSAVEGAMDVVLTVELIKNTDTPWPRLENDDWIMSIGSGRPLESAWKVALHDMIGWVGRLCGLSEGDAYQLVSQVAFASIANVVDPNYTVVVKVPKALLPPIEPYAGIHTKLRGAARSR
jgi:acetamidase/formamidase